MFFTSNLNFRAFSACLIGLKSNSGSCRVRAENLDQFTTLV